MTHRQSFVVPQKRAVLIPVLVLLAGGAGITYGLVRHLRAGGPGAAAVHSQEEVPGPIAAPEGSALNQPPPAALASSGGKEGEPKGPVTIRMEPLVANLDEGDQLRYLKISLQLEVEAEAQQRIQAALPRARHEALMYLSGLHLSDTQGLSGKQRIHRELSRRIADAVGRGLKRVFFDEFVVQ
jgi:flagellar FliL protein